MSTIWHIPDDIWNEMTKILPPEKPADTVGRPIVPYRIVDGIIYVIRTGCQWKKKPKEEYASGFTCQRF